MTAARIPGATYRLQLNAELDFARVAKIVDYLDELGVTDLYLSPVLAARQGSAHGYDVVDPSRVNPELGTEEELVALGARLRERGMGVVLDVVANHVCIAVPENPWWVDVLENGPSSPHARAFDIDWAPPKPDLAAKVLLPFLGDQFGRVLENREIELRYEDGTFVAAYWGARFPIAPKTWKAILNPALDALLEDRGHHDPGVLELESIVRSLEHLPPRTATDEASVRERAREKLVARRRLGALLEQDAGARAALAASIAKLNGRRGDPASFDALEALLAEQGYRLAFWRVAADEINYRRFFDVNELAAVRVEEPTVFAALHDTILRLVAKGAVTGLRIDHVDGLLDPERYLADVQQGCARALGRTSDDPRALFVLVEKILGPRERLPSSWPVHGTTGYELLNAVQGVFVDRAGVEAIGRRFGSRLPFADIAHECKRLVLRVALSSELTVLAQRLDRISEQHRVSRDFTLRGLHEALGHVIACFPVYRTYAKPGDLVVSPNDRAHVEAAVREAKRRNPATSASLFDFIRSLLLLENASALGDDERRARQDFVLRFQQLTGPVMAKAVEDTAFYRHVPLACLNEVGGEPDRGGTTPDELHRWNAERLEAMPHGGSATATHDTKRGEDTRLRIAALSEVPQEWIDAVGRWRALNEALRTEGSPDEDEEYLIYQTLVGAWPPGGAGADFAARMTAYATKALREAKVHTSWVSPNTEHEQAVARFIETILQHRPFVEDFAAFHAPLARAAALATLSSVVLKVASPGVPDFYQGCELHDLSLVDPDNRRPVDFEVRRALLDRVRRELEADPAAAAARALGAGDGSAKLLVTHRALVLRRRCRPVFDRGDYVAVPVQGPRGRHVIAFARAAGRGAVLAVATRFHVALARDRGSWTGTRLELPPGLEGRYRDAIAGVEVEAKGSLDLDEALARMPVALLERVG